ncbi:gamma carbonic anhydrase family protein [Chloroflexota bacterium]
MLRGFRGKMPKIAESAFVYESAQIIGDVEIGDGCSIWPGVVIRADLAGWAPDGHDIEIGGNIKIGNNTHIEDNAVIHISRVIGNNVVIGHGAVVEAVKIGDNVLIGDNAALLPNSEVGNFCLIGAGTVVSEGMKIPDGSFVAGVPAEIRGKLSADQMARVKKAPSNIAAIMNEHKKEVV